MSLRIAQIAPLGSGLPPASYSGTELMVLLLAEEMMRRGHEVTLFALDDPAYRGAARGRPSAPSERFAAMVEGCAYECAHYSHAAVAAALERKEHST